MIERELIFVYNADSGRLNGAIDFFHKIFSPKTYNCQLCKVTYGIAGMDKEWKRFVESSRIPFRFLHKDEWQHETGRSDQLPAVFERINDELKMVIPAGKMNGLSLQDLKTEIQALVN